MQVRGGGPKGKQHLLAGDGVGEPNWNDWTESLALCILCGDEGGESMHGEVSMLPDTTQQTPHKHTLASVVFALKGQSREKPEA